MRNMSPFSEILSRIQEFPLRKVGVSPKESPGLDRVNSLRTKNKKIRTYWVLINEMYAKKPSDLPFSLKKRVFIGVSAREVLFRDLP